MLRLLPRVHRGLTAAAALNLVVAVGIPTAFIVAGGRFVGALPAAVRSGGDPAGSSRLWSALVVLAVVYACQQLVVPVLDTATQALARRVDEHVLLRVMAAVGGPSSTAHLEESGTLDVIAQATGATTNGETPGVVVPPMVATWSSRLVSLVSGLILLRFHWWIGVALIAAPVAMLGVWQRFYREATRAIFLGSTELRRSAYLRMLGVAAAPAKEVRVFGLGGWLGERFHDTWTTAMTPVFAAWRSGRMFMVVIAAVPGTLMTVAFVLIARDGVAGRLSLAEVTVYATAVRQVVFIGGISDLDRRIHAGLACLGALGDLEAASAATQPSIAVRVLPAGAPVHRIRFESMGFTYPGRSAPVFQGLDLELEAGRSTAVVGVNGAGKTTLVKLLCRLRDPDSGRITVDDIDLADIDPVTWQRNVAAIFQDFARYNLSAHDNIALGRPEYADDRDGVVAAATRAGITETIDALAEGWETPLDRQRTGGAELSGGQWQRLAIARALFATAHGARVLILDEPAANLDVRTEADLYDRFLELTGGLTTLVISHRFSTVRRADTIIVIDAGRVVEQGSHAELVAAGGRYAEMFDLQARRFTEGYADELGVDSEEAVTDA
ncbi:MAG: ABC transporter ATP-binding protein [Actinobacteria bacterium]|nr:ABC transporter ATP-binding protein [Actinomycetota bacterium]